MISLWIKSLNISAVLEKCLGHSTVLYWWSRNFGKFEIIKGFYSTVYWSIKRFQLIYELLIAKLNANWFDTKSLNFILAYFTNRKQKTKIGSSFSDFVNIFFDVPKVQYSDLFFSLFTCLFCLWNMT